VHPIVSLQMEYSLWARDPENGNIQACREHGMGFMAYSALGRGFLGGLFHDLTDLPEDDNRRNSPRFQGKSIEQGRKLLSTVEAIAKEKSGTPAQVALAWVMAQGPDIIPIPGCKSRRHLEDNLGALELELTKDDLARLDTALPREAVSSGKAREQLYRVSA
jgi:aryl-alcohol dehydrogenase-like predicted oxidoreductase